MKIKITFIDKRTGKDLWKDGEVKSFCDYTPPPAYVDDISQVIPAIRSAFWIDDDVELYTHKDEANDVPNWYWVQYFSGSSQHGCNMSEYQMERFKAGKCCGWNHDILIELEKVTYEPLTDFPVDE